MTTTDIRPEVPRDGSANSPPAPADEALPPAHELTVQPRPGQVDGRPTMPAGRALQVTLLALLVTAVFNAGAMVQAGEGMRPGATRTAVLAVARPLEAVTSALWIDRPRQLLGSLFGSDDESADKSALLQTDIPTPGPATVEPVRRPTPAAPLRLLVTGDSMTEHLGPVLLKAASGSGAVLGRTKVHYGTGLVRPDFFDWSLAARRLLASHKPEAVVVMMGGNDGQGMTLPGRRILPAASAEWTAEYRRRAQVVMSTFTAGGARRVYWVGMPVPRSRTLADDYAQINSALAEAAAAVPGVRYVDIAPPLSRDGAYSAYLPDEDGRTVLARAKDGIHLTKDGARIAASSLLRAMDEDWHLLR